MAYMYQQNFFEGSSYGYVKYNISPSFGVYIAPGEQITITGQAYCRNSAKDGITVGFAYDISAVSSFSSGSYSISISKGKVTTFKIVYTMPEARDNMPEGRTIPLFINFVLWKGNTGDGTMTSSAQAITFLRYRLVRSLFADFGRYSLSDGSYVQDSANGTYALGSIQLALADEHMYDEITIATTTIRAADGTIVATRSIPIGILQAATTIEGYSETVTGLFTDVLFSLNTTYLLMFEIGDSYSTVVFTDTLPKAFANMCLSSSDNGVCFGGFPKATTDNPMLESYYPLYLYAGFGNPTDVVATLKASVVDLIYPVGSIYLSLSSVSPETLFGGTWTQIQNTFLLAAGSAYAAGSTGGSTIHSHAAPVGYNANNKAFGVTFAAGVATFRINGSFAATGDAVVTDSGTFDWNLAQTSDGSSLPPYLAVYVWRRMS